MLWHYGHGVSFVSACQCICAHHVSYHTDIVVDNCAICRNHIMDLCKLLTLNHVYGSLIVTVKL